MKKVLVLYSGGKDSMLTLFISLFKKYGVHLLLPVKDLKDDFQEQNEFLMRGIIPKVNESKCLIGMPLNSNVVDEEIVSAAIEVYQNLLFPKVESLIQKYKNIQFGEEYV